jgi:hypothetical protein
LEIQLGGIDAMIEHAVEHLRQIIGSQACGTEQLLFGLLEYL